MSRLPPRTEDRRRHARGCDIIATAVVFSPDRLHGTYLVQDVSAGGAALVGDVGLPPGTLVSVLLQFPGKTAFSVAARVVRLDGERRPTATGAQRTALAFIELAAEEDGIHEAIVAALERERARRSATILVLDADRPSRHALERDLRALGHEAVGASTPLEALAWLEQPEMHIATMIVDLSEGPAAGLDVLDFLDEQHPHIRRVVMSGELRPFRLDLALRSGRAHQVLRKPWDRARLAQALAGTPGTTAQLD